MSGLGGLLGGQSGIGGGLLGGGGGGGGSSNNSNEGGTDVELPFKLSDAPCEVKEMEELKANRLVNFFNFFFFCCRFAFRDT